MAEQGHWLCFADYQLCLPFSRLEHCWAARFLGVVTNPSSQMGHSTSTADGMGLVPVPLPGWDEEGPLQATLNFSNRLPSWEDLGATLSLGYELISLPVHDTGSLHTWYWLCFVPEPVMSSGCLPLGWSGWSTTGPNSFQDLLPALLVRWPEDTLHSGWAVTLLFPWVWANQAQGPDTYQVDLYPAEFPGCSAPPTWLCR